MMEHQNTEYQIKNGVLSKPVEQYCKKGMFIME